MTSTAAPPAPRGLGASVRRSGGDVPGRGSDLGVRLTALEQAVEAARGRLDDVLLDEALASVERAGARLRLSATHTVVAIAGATGSGKSATFNALAGTEISRSTAQRPTTSRAKALIWGETGEEVDQLLDWLGVDPADRTTRADLGDRVRRDRLPEGLILLDLPDHDSVETAHHEEAHRVVALADALVWVVDPQKYADAAIHREFLRPLAGHRDVTMVVLNHLDTVPEDRRQWMLRDVRRVVAQDGMRDARILGVSARHGLGMDDLRAALRRRVEEKRHSVLRVDADLRTASERLAAAAGDAPTDLPAAWVADLERRVADAAGVDTVLARLERADAERRRRGLWRPAGGETPGLRFGAVDRRAVGTAVRALTDQACGTLAPGWADPIRERTAQRPAAVSERVEAELAALRAPESSGVGAGFRSAQVGAVLLALAGVGATVRALLAAAGATLPVALVAVGIGLLVLVAGAGRRAADRAAHRWAGQVGATVRRTIGRAVDQGVALPIQQEIAAYAAFRKALDRIGR